jgi:tetratricopeptide (TPR) repeat protein
MKSSTFFTALAGCSLFLTLSANAAVSVFGDGKAHDCFIAAKTGINLHAGLAICNAALNDDPLTTKNLAATYINRGVIEVTLGQHEDAMADYNHGIALTPDLGDAYVDRGSAYIFLKRYDDAMADINKGIALGVSYPEIGYYNRGLAEELTGKYKEAYYDFKHVLELQPNFTKASDELKYFTVTTVKKPAT